MIHKEIKILKSFKYYYFDNFKHDLDQRKKCINNIFKTVLLFVMQGTSLLQINMILDINNSLVGEKFIILISLIIVFFLIILLGNTKFGSVLVVFSSTLFGFLIILITVFLILMMFLSLINFVQEFLLESTVKFSFLDVMKTIFSEEFYKMLYGIIILFNNKMVTVINTFIAILIPLIIVLFSPKYLFGRIKILLTVSNYTSNLTVLLMLFLKEEISNIVYQFFIRLPSEVVEEITELAIEVLEKQINSETDFINIFEVFTNAIFLPYIGGSFIGLIIMELIWDFRTKKAKVYYYKALSYFEDGDNYQYIYFAKKSVLNGGDLYELGINANKNYKNCSDNFYENNYQKNKLNFEQNNDNSFDERI